MVQRTYAVMANDVLISIPLFVFMGYIIERANILYKASEILAARAEDVVAAVDAAAPSDGFTDKEELDLGSDPLDHCGGAFDVGEHEGTGDARPSRRRGRARGSGHIGERGRCAPHVRRGQLVAAQHDDRQEDERVQRLQPREGDGPPADPLLQLREGDEAAARRLPSLGWVPETALR